MASKPQTGGKNLEGSGAESAEKTAETKEVVVQRWVMYSPES